MVVCRIPTIAIFSYLHNLQKQSNQVLKPEAERGEIQGEGETWPRQIHLNMEAGGVLHFGILSPHLKYIEFNKKCSTDF